MSVITDFAVLGTLIAFVAVGFSAFAGNASGTPLEMFKLGQQSTEIMAALFLPVGIYIVAKKIT